MRLLVCTYSLGEDTLVAQVGIGYLFDFGIRSIWVDDAVLPSNSLPVPLGIISLLLLKVLELALEGPFERLDLRPLCPIIGVAQGVLLQKLDLVLDLCVPDLRVGYNGLEFGTGAVVGRGEHALVNIGNSLDVRSKLTDALLCAFNAREEIISAQRLGPGRLDGVALARQAVEGHVCMRDVLPIRLRWAQGTSLRILRRLRVIGLAMALERCWRV